MVLQGLVTPLILYGRVILSCSSRALPWSVFYRAQVSSTFVSRRLLTSHCVSLNVTLLIQYDLYHPQDSKTFPLAKVASIHSCQETLSCYGRRARQSPRAMAPPPMFESLNRTVTCTRGLIGIYMCYSQAEGLNTSLSRLSYLVRYTVAQLLFSGPPCLCTLSLYGT